ncbi:MAG: hypothetical protein AABZ30_00490 [Myxococcota bacterium]
MAVLAFSVFIVQATGPANLFLPTVCQESCPDDDARGNCAPNCSDCACCGHLLAAALPAQPRVLASAPSVARVWRTERVLPIAELPAIEHVPKPSRG